MEAFISKLLDHEHGRMTRRQLVQSIALAVVAGVSFWSGGRIHVHGRRHLLDARWDQRRRGRLEPRGRGLCVKFSLGGWGPEASTRE